MLSCCPNSRILPRMHGTAQAGTLTRGRWMLNPLGSGPWGLGGTANLRTPTAFFLYLTLQGWVLTTR
jgi:hypothetical protein